MVIHVQKDDGSPFARALVKAEGPNISVEVTTGVDGLATIPLPATFPKYLSVRVRKDGFVPKLITWSLDQPSFTLPKNFTLKMEKAQSIGGVVRNDDGQPVEEAQVVLIIRGSSMGGVAQEVFNDIWERRVTTDQEGKWHFDEAPSDLRPLQVRLEHPDYASDKEIYPRPSDAQFKDQTALLVLHRGMPVDGVVTDENGRPLSGVDVVFGEAGSDSTSYPSIQTNAAGHFHFGGLSIKGWSMPPPILTFTSDNYAPEMVELRPSTVRKTLDVQMKPGQRLRVRLTDQQGHPIKDVTLAADDWRGHRPFRGIRFQSDHDGLIVWDHAPDDPITYALLTDSFQNQNLILQPKNEVQVIRLKRQTVVSGRVLDATTEKPVTAFNLIFGTYYPPQVPGWTGWARGAALHFQGNSYRYVFSGPAQMDSRDGITPGTEGFHRIRIEAPGYDPAVSRPIANDEESVSLDFQLKPASAIHGVVRADGSPVKNAQIVVAGPGNAVQIVEGFCRDTWEQQIVTTNERGVYNLPPQEADFPMAIIQRDAGYWMGSYSALKASPNVTLLSWGELDISTTARGNANPQYFVRYADEDQPSSQPPRIRFQTYKPSDVQNGSLIYKHLPAGAIKIGMYNRDMNEGEIVQIENGKTTHIDLGTGKSAVTGRISLPPGASTDYPLAMLSLRPVLPDPPYPLHLAQDQRRAWFQSWITTPEGKAYQTKAAEIPFTLDGAGNFRLDDIAPGAYQLIAIFFRSLPTGPQAKGDVLGVAHRKFELMKATGDYDLGNLPVQTDVH